MADDPTSFVPSFHRSSFLKGIGQPITLWAVGGASVLPAKNRAYAVFRSRCRLPEGHPFQPVFQAGPVSK